MQLFKTITVFITDVWKLGQDGVYFALGPLRVVNFLLSQEDLDNLENLKPREDKVRPVLERVIDYEYQSSYEKDRFTLYLKDGSTEERSFNRSKRSRWNEKTKEKEWYSEASKPAQKFGKRLSIICGY